MIYNSNERYTTQQVTTLTTEHLHMSCASEMLSKLHRIYSKNRLVSNMGIYLVLYGAGDFTRQTLQGVAHYNYGDTLRMSVVGSCFIAPMSFAWYRILDGFIVGTSYRHVAKKIAVDQCLSPLFLSVFYTGSSVLEGQKDVFADLRTKGFKTWQTGICFWPLVQIFNFRYVPAHYRVTYVACAAYLWTIVLSYFKYTWHEADKARENVVPAAPK